MIKTAQFNRFSVDMPDEAVSDMSGSGDQTESVEYWNTKLKVDAERSDIESELDEYGCWEDLKTADIDTLTERIIWLAACDINEEKGDDNEEN